MERTVTAPVVVRVPGDKSISHRALLFAALAHGPSTLRNLLPGEDVQSTARVLRQLGCDVPEVPASGAEVRITGQGPAGWRAPVDVLDCGNSGTTARLLLGILASRPFAATLTGDASLRARPMRRVTAPLAAAGARFFEHGDADRLPITVEGGPLAAIRYDSPHASAQVKTALLLAALCADTGADLTEPQLSRDHTERMFGAAGVRIDTTVEPGRVRHRMRAGQRLRPFSLDVPGDPSSAAFLIALGLLGDRPVTVEGVSLNPTRTGLLPVLTRMGARLAIEPGETTGEPAGSITAWPSSLTATNITPEEVPALLDEVPVLAVLASRATGVTRVEGAGELRVKESDRLAVLATNLSAVGVEVAEWADGIAVHGTQAPPRGRIATHHDHRIAMAFGVLAALPGADVQIDVPALAAVSYPGFWDDLARVTG